ncbi:MAG: cyclic nucleotide-binding domain-containing protein [gamma proteobacterium symbiont of Bathyaustriella thionipta]|nr:cyclic nucleotide-binding domain-containing protein [gamma proteobacterium symbiont of Bathyaustriella thionipta]
MTKNEISQDDAWSGKTHCEQCNIRQTVLFAELEQEDFNNLHTPIEQQHFNHHQVIYRMGDNANALFTLRTGLVKLVRYTTDGQARIVRLVRPSQSFGLDALLEESYEHDAIALQPVELCRLPVPTVTELW